MQSPKPLTGRPQRPLGVVALHNRALRIIRASTERRENRAIRISQSLWQGNLQTTKTDHSVRVLPIRDHLLHTLAKHKEQSMHTAPDDFVFCHPNGSSFDPEVFKNDVVYPTIEAGGVLREKRGLSPGMRPGTQPLHSFTKAQTT
jgi:hypothetical protein